MMWKIHDLFILPSFPKNGKQVLPVIPPLFQCIGVWSSILLGFSFVLFFIKQGLAFLNDALTIRTIRSQYPPFHGVRT
ncbi:hypothetical protein T4B_11539 [Trichinella pseudospiralis]|uniref:Uncharacterized protein n=1 Tax=Trichinella pseudospiralis TaxID=6337 RepID=A0A0V1KBU8_TRIPS|nr:hypothetical protein T4A_8607 [Trichinella pseudospiralis]KRZ23700.1 hypothetical protein T4B_11539 [Trichinella pseudospiralis]KRZ44616.1 hypothetical protein T4C_10948 [Trichinella pseudospiralis]